jgi:membrane protease YdiL (CAAX protease family)
VTHPSSPPVLPGPTPPSTPEGWYSDPYGAVGVRYWDGNGWTSHVAYPTAESWANGPPPTLGAGAAPLMIGVVVATWFAIPATVVPIAHAFGAPVAVAYSYVVLFGAMAVVALWASRRFGTGDLRRDLGLRFKRLDLLVFVVGGIGLWILEIILAVFLRLGDVPTRSNGETISQVRDRPAVFAVLAFAAIVGAPIFEEICFRGVIQRSLNSWMSGVAAVIATGCLFGIYHYTPQFGTGNLGMVMMLAALGMALGALAHRTGRLAPSMLAHSGLNTIVMTVLLLTAPHLA